MKQTHSSRSSFLPLRGCLCGRGRCRRPLPLPGWKRHYVDCLCRGPSPRSCTASYSSPTCASLRLRSRARRPAWSPRRGATSRWSNLRRFDFLLPLVNGRFPNRLNVAALSFVTATALLMISSAGASKSSKSANPEPAYGTSSGERHDEQVISECDHKADRATVPESERMDFIRKCLEERRQSRSILAVP